mgnify:CR=1 FL=1
MEKWEKKFLLERYSLINSVLKEVMLEINKYFSESYTRLSYEEFLLLVKSFYKGGDNNFENEFFNLPDNASNTDYYKAYNIKMMIDASGLTAKEKPLFFSYARRVYFKMKSKKLDKDTEEKLSELRKYEVNEEDE